MKDNKGPLLIKAPEASKILGIPKRTLYELAASGKIPHRRVDSRVYFRRADLERFAAGDVDPPASSRPPRTPQPHPQTPGRSLPKVDWNNRP